MQVFTSKRLRDATDHKAHPILDSYYLSLVIKKTVYKPASRNKFIQSSTFCFPDINEDGL